jgi:hypothetical protein
MCADCVACLGKVYNPDTDKNVFFRCFSFIATKENLIYLKREQILEHILNPPDSEFVFCVTYSNKKHMCFKARVNSNRYNYIVTTDIGDVRIDTQEVHEILWYIEPWYSMIPGKADTKAQPTWFTKSDILNGCENTKRIQDYGINRYFNENQKIGKWRGSALLKLLTFALNKKGPNNANT